MSFRFHLTSFLYFLSILLIEILIAAFGTGIIRHFIGDVLVVILLFFFVESFFNIKKKQWLIIGIFVFSLIIEGLQYFKTANHLGIKNKVLNIILGSTFDWYDILAYFLGCLAIFIYYKTNDNKRKS